MLFTFSGVGFGYGDNLIFSHVDFAVNEGDRVGLVGENGVGKTTLIKLLLGELTADDGEVIRKNGLTVGYLAQDGGYDGTSTVYGEMRQVFKRELDAIEKLNELSAKLSACEYGSREYAALSSSMEALNKFVASRDCFNVDVKIKTVLNGMGFSDFYDRDVSSMSGGEKTRLKLARLLLEQPDVLVLDEPTNHLDVKTLYWLEGYLSSFKGAIFVVSHDRYFLDKVVSQIVEIENKTLSSYRGNYTKYKQLKAERYDYALKQYEKQQEEIRKLQTYVDKNIVRATTAKSAQSRVKQLEKMELLEKPYLPPKPPRFTFSYSQQPAEAVITISGMELSAGGKRLICGGQLEIRRGQKVAIVGDNGTGKSTLLRTIVNGSNPAVSVGRHVEFAYYEQENANLNPENTVLQEMWERHVAYTQTEVRASLASCGLFPEDMDKKVSSLSGGERVKLALCVFENSQGNVLVLDEPTNHLDLPARESLEKALKDFDGTVLFVSHDRYFITAVADRVAEIEDGKLTVYEGGYEFYMRAKEEIKSERRAKEEEEKRAEYERERESSYRSKKERAEQARYRAEMKSLEQEISQCELRERELEEMLADPAVAADYTKMKVVLDELQALCARLDGLYARYGELIG